MANWLTPKTDWNASVDELGNYIGDRFNASDYNRIKNNIQYLRDLALNTYNDFNLSTLNDKNVGDYVFADEINTIEDNLETLNLKTRNMNIGENKTFYPNGVFIDFNELNRLESATVKLYEKIYEKYEHRRMLSQNFEKGGMSW